MTFTGAGGPNPSFYLFNSTSARYTDGLDFVIFGQDGKPGTYHVGFDPAQGMRTPPVSVLPSLGQVRRYPDDLCLNCGVDITSDAEAVYVPINQFDIPPVDDEGEFVYGDHPELTHIRVCIQCADERKAA